MRHGFSLGVGPPGGGCRLQGERGGGEERIAGFGICIEIANVVIKDAKTKKMS